MIGKVTGQELQHISLSDETESRETGMPEDYAGMLVGLDQRIRENGSEDQ